MVNFPKAKIAIFYNIEGLIEEMDVISIERCANWARLAKMLLDAYEQENIDISNEKISQLRETGIKYLESCFRTLNKTNLYTLNLPGGGTNFESLARLVKKIACIANITYKSATEGKVSLGNLALSACAFAEASKVRSSNGDTKEN